MTEDPAQVWIAGTTARINELNNTPECGVFEVRASGTLLGGDIVLSKGEDDEFEVEMEGIKPGIWKLVEQDESALILRWIAPGPLSSDLSLVAALTGPHALEGVNWDNIGSFSVDSGTAAVLDKDIVDELSATEDVGREVAMETLMDPEWESGPIDGHGFVVPGGIVMQGNDGGYRIFGRKNEAGRIVEIKVKFA